MTNLFQLNLVLAAGWCALFATFNLSTFIAGFVISFAALTVTSPLYADTTYFRQSRYLVQLIAYFLGQLTISTLKVSWDVLTPTQKSRPAIVAIPLDITEPMHITILANMISLTPGSLSLDVNPSRDTLYVHCMFVDDPDAIRANIKSGFERMIREALQ